MDTTVDMDTTPVGFEVALAPISYPLTCREVSTPTSYPLTYPEVLATTMATTMDMVNTVKDGSTVVACVAEITQLGPSKTIASLTIADTPSATVTTTAMDTDTGTDMVTDTGMDTAMDTGTTEDTVRIPETMAKEEDVLLATGRWGVTDTVNK